MSRLLTNPMFWMMIFVVSWLITITMLIVNGYGAPADGRGGAP